MRDLPLGRAGRGKNMIVERFAAIAATLRDQLAVGFDSIAHLVGGLGAEAAA